MSADPLGALEEALRRCEPAVMEAASAGIALAGLQRIERGFARGVDMQGRPFKLPKDGRRPPMVRSGALRDANLVRLIRSAGANQIIFYNPREYASYTNDGTSKMEARQHMPRPGERPPPDLDAAWGRACGEAHERYWGRVRL